MFDVQFCRFSGVVQRVLVMPVGSMGMMRGLFVIT
jgi:hypothetical protein